MLYNTNKEVKEVVIDVGPREMNIYDVVKTEFIVRNLSSSFEFNMCGDNAVVLVLVPKHAKIEARNGKWYANDIIIDYRFARP